MYFKWDDGYEPEKVIIFLKSNLPIGVQNLTFKSIDQDASSEINIYCKKINKWVK